MFGIVKIFFTFAVVSIFIRMGNSFFNTFCFLAFITPSKSNTTAFAHIFYVSEKNNRFKPPFIAEIKAHVAANVQSEAATMKSAAATMKIVAATGWIVRATDLMAGAIGRSVAATEVFVVPTVKSVAATEWMLAATNCSLTSKKSFKNLPEQVNIVLTN